MALNKTFKFEIKEFGDNGTFQGFASTYGNVDLGGDVVDPGAFAKTIQEKDGEFPILWQHNMREPIGLGKVMDSPTGLLIKGQLVLGVSRAKEAYDLLKAGVMKGLSIGYDTVRDEVKDKVRHLKELKLYEVSLVTFPMNELATVSSVKSEADLVARVDALELVIQKFLAPDGQHAAKAPADDHAAKQEEIAPEILHPISRIEKLLRGEL